MGQNHDELMERAVSLPIFRTSGADSVVARKAQGPKVYDLDSIGYVDYMGGGGSSVLGFANQFVLDAVKKALDSGVPVGFHVPHEVDLAEKLTPFLPWVERWWFCRNPDEAMHGILAWARRCTGRPVILCLSGGAPLGISDHPAPDLVREVPSWEVESIVEAVHDGVDDLAAVVIEPLMTRYGLIPLERETVGAVAGACREIDVPLIFDERVSGFRLARGGAAEWAGVTPDAAVYGSALGGGFPIGAVGFAAGAPATEPGEGRTVASPHSVSLAAAEAVLSILKNDTTYARLEERSLQLADGIRNLADRFQRAIVVNHVGSVFALYLGVDEVADGEAATRSDAEAYRRLVGGLRDEGVLLPPAANEAGFVSAAHGAKDIEATLTAFERVLLRFRHEDRP